MAKCPKCGGEVESGAKFCMECGEAIPQTKECPKCHAQWPLKAKFCAECGFNFNAAGGGSVIGDKNVIAGDVHIDQSTTTNNTVTNVINQDETKKVTQCAVCGRQMAIVDAHICPNCHATVCVDHFDYQRGVCTRCAAEDKASAADRYKAKYENVLRTGAVGIEERKMLDTLGADLRLDKSVALKLEEAVRLNMGQVTTVTVKIAGPAIKIGRQPFRKMEDVGCVNGGKYCQPESCLDCGYLFNCRDFDLSANVTWRDRHGELSCVEASVHDENENGPRFVRAGESYGVIRGSGATLFISKATGSEVTATVSFEVFGELVAEDISIEYMTARFDEDVVKLVSVRYRSRELAIDYEDASISLGNEQAVCRNSWVCKDDDGYNINFNAYAPNGSIYNAFKVESDGAKVWSLIVSDLATANAFAEKIKEGGVAAEQVIAMFKEQRDHGTFIMSDCCQISRARHGGVQYDRLDGYATEECGDFLVSLFDYDEVEEVEKSGKAILIYLELRKARWVFDMFTVRNFDGGDHFRVWEDVLLEDSPRLAVLNAIDCSSPGFGKCDDYVSLSEEETDEFCNEIKAQRDDAKVDLYGDVSRRMLVVITKDGRQVIEI